MASVSSIFKCLGLTGFYVLFECLHTIDMHFMVQVAMWYLFSIMFNIEVKRIFLEYPLLYFLSIYFYSTKSSKHHISYPCTILSFDDGRDMISHGLYQ